MVCVCVRVFVDAGGCVRGAYAHLCVFLSAVACVSACGYVCVCVCVYVCVCVFVRLCVLVAKSARCSFHHRSSLFHQTLFSLMDRQSCPASALFNVVSGADQQCCFCIALRRREV